jgi:putative tryptophan/tyrosine transport system substrate-binding protein
VRRREFLTVTGCVVSWPFLAQAQQSKQIRRIGVLMNVAADSQDAPVRIAALAQGLAGRGWTIGGNVEVDYRWYAGDADASRKYAEELIALKPDVFLATGTLAATALQRIAGPAPVVFILVADPVGAGLVDSLAQPGSNLTGFMNFEYGASTKWLDLLKQLAPDIKRAAVLRDRANPAGTAQFGAMQTAASSLGVELNAINVRDASEIERGIAAIARSANAGLIVTASASAGVNRDLIVQLAARHKLPAVYSNRFEVTGGGLLSYGLDRADQYRRAADYIDRILNGEKPANLPVQAPTKYELVINLKTAKLLGLAVPPNLLAIADEVID